MTKDTILIAVLLCVGSTVVQSALAEVPLGSSPERDIDTDIGAPAALYELLDLNESQIESLTIASGFGWAQPKLRWASVSCRRAC